MKDESVIAITSKIVALAEGRVRTIATKEEKIALMEEESDQVLETKWTYLTVKDGQVYASAGIDESNVDTGLVVLLPKDSYGTAQTLRAKLLKHYGIANLGVIITDSRVLPLRQGALGVALGFAGFEGIRDYRGTEDLYGKKLKVSRANIADSLAVAAVVCMGEGKERTPLAIITEAPVEFTDRIVTKEDLTIALEDDIYLPFYTDLKLF